MLPLVLILLMCQTSPWTNQNRNDLESEASQLLHQKSIDFNCKNCFQRGMPFRAVHPPRNSKGKTTPIKNRPHNCEVDPFARKETDAATCTYTIGLHHELTKTELTWNQKLHTCFITRVSISIAKMVFKGICPSELFAPQETVREKPPQLKIGPTAVWLIHCQKSKLMLPLYLYY